MTYEYTTGVHTCADHMEVIADLLADLADWEAYEADLAESDPWATDEEPDFEDMARDF